MCEPPVVEVCDVVVVSHPMDAVGGTEPPGASGASGRSRSRSPSFSSSSSRRSSSESSSSTSSSTSFSSSSESSAASSRRYRTRRRLEGPPRDYHRDSTHRVAAPQELGATNRPDVCCVRIGVFRPTVPVTKAQVIDEMDAIRMTSRVEEVIVEPPCAHGADREAPTYARIYFASPEWADLCAIELNIPRRKSKWRHMVSQRLPRLGPMCGEIKTIPAFEPFRAEPADSIVVETPEGYVVFSTDELYRTRGAIEYLDEKRHGVIMHCCICRAFDPQQYTPCEQGVNCRHIHVKAVALWKLLLPTTAKQPLRALMGDQNKPELSLWEYCRRWDTLVLRYLPAEHDVKSLTFMFGGCEGFAGASIQCTKEGKRFGFVQFRSKPLAFAALLQTNNSNLNVSYYGVMEDIRSIQSSVVTATPVGRENCSNVPTSSGVVHREKPVLRSGGARRPETHFRGTSTASGAAQVFTEGPTPNAQGAMSGLQPSTGSTSTLPFPQLPDGWEHGVSRRTRQFYFFQPKTKNSTTWKHPVTLERYSTP